MTIEWYYSQLDPVIVALHKFLQFADPAKLQSYYSIGKPIIASNHGGVKETIIDGVNSTGFKVKANDHLDLAEKINLIVNSDRKNKNDLKERAINNIKDNFSLNSMCKKTLDVYKRILNVSN